MVLPLKSQSPSVPVSESVVKPSENVTRPPVLLITTSSIVLASKSTVWSPEPDRVIVPLPFDHVRVPVPVWLIVTFFLKTQFGLLTALLMLNVPELVWIVTLQSNVADTGVLVPDDPLLCHVNCVPLKTLPFVHDPGVYPPQVVVAIDHVPPALLEYCGPVA